MYIYRCEDSVEGIFTAIYDAWASGHPHEENRIEVEEEGDRELCLFAEDISVVPDAQKSRKVQDAIRRRVSEEAYDMSMKAILSQAPEKGDVLYRFLILAFREGASACRSYGNPWVMRLFELVRGYDNEAHHLKGFLRFAGKKDGVLLARYAPKNHVLNELMVHFSDRLNTENFVIFDEKRNVAGIHEAGGEWYVYRLTEEEAKALTDRSGRSAAEDGFADLWRIFHRYIAIGERENPRLQRGNLPLRFRPYMTEFM